MKSRVVRAAFIFGLSAILCGCAAIRSTESVVIDYNRAFANSRNEMLVLNILRAAAREPMQFSTMGTVTGQVGNGGSLTIPFTNVIAGGRDIISPSLQINDAVNPSITIVPFGAKEFVSGIMTPITPERIQLFLNGGWDAQFLLPLIVEGVVCSNGRYLANSGLYEVGGSTATNDAFREFFRESAPGFAIETQNAPGDERVFTISDDDAIGLLRDGLGSNYTVHSVVDAAPGTKRVTVRPARRTVIRGLEIGRLCARLAASERSALPASLTEMATSTTEGGRVVLRSVQTIVYYLGESHRVRFNANTRNTRGLTYYGPNNGEVQTLFKLEWSPSLAPHAVATSFHGREFHIPRLELGEHEGRDRTLKTLSFLDLLISLQTSESTIRGSQPILAIPQ